MFGGVERESGRCFMVPVERRDQETLLPIIKKWILPGTEIHSDCWRAYNCLESEGYIHLSVNHSLTFKDPVSNACTNSIEGSWRAAKNEMPSSDRRRKFFAGYLCRYMFTRRCRIENLDHFMEFIKILCNFNSDFSLDSSVESDSESE